MYSTDFQFKPIFAPDSSQFS